MLGSASNTGWMIAETRRKLSVQVPCMWVLTGVFEKLVGHIDVCEIQRNEEIVLLLRPHVFLLLLTAS